MIYSNLGFIFHSSINKKYEQTAELLFTVCLCFSARFQQSTCWQHNVIITDITDDHDDQSNENQIQAVIKSILKSLFKE